MSFQDSDSGLGYGLEGTSAKRIGVVGKSDSGPGVLGESHESFDTNKIISATSVGVMGAARTGSGVLGFSEDATGVAGGSIKGIGVYGIGAQAEGVRGLSAKSDGIHGVVSNDNASGVRGTNNLTGDGVSGTSQGGNGVYGETDTLGNVPTQGKVGSGVFGFANPWGYGVLGYSPRGPAAVSGFSDEGLGVFGQSNSDSGIGVYGRGGDVKGVGVSGQGKTGVAGNGVSLGVVGNGITGIQGSGDPNYGVGVSGTGLVGVSGTGPLGGFSIGVSGTGGFIGVSGDGLTGVMGQGGVFGVVGTLNAGVGGVLAAGVSGMGTSTQTGVSGISENGRAIWGLSTNGSGIEGFSAAGHAGWFNGDVNINGKLSKSGGGFKIDHPLAPEAMYLNHSFVESPDMKNFYDGEAVLGPKGDATVELPRWFEALNADLHYQLTSIGDGAPELHIASEVRRGRFRIAGGRPGMKVCWQVTGTRQDAWARRNRITVEEKKTGTERGKYRHPEAFRKPEELSVQWARDPQLLRMLLKHRKRGASLISTYSVLMEKMAKKGNRNARSRDANRGVSGLSRGL